MANPIFSLVSRIPKVGLEPTRPCGQRILSAADPFVDGTVAERLCDFCGRGAVRLRERGGSFDGLRNNRRNRSGPRAAPASAGQIRVACEKSHGRLLPLYVAG